MLPLALAMLACNYGCELLGSQRQQEIYEGYKVIIDKEVQQKNWDQIAFFIIAAELDLPQDLINQLRDYADLLHSQQQRQQEIYEGYKAIIDEEAQQKNWDQIALFIIAAELDLPQDLINQLRDYADLLRSQQEQKRHEEFREDNSGTNLTRTEATAILGVPENATKEEIKKAYLAKAMLFHSDKWQKHQKKTGIHSEEKATEKMQELNNAYDILKKASSSR
jgi:DnaJ-domain-containing protein 1